MTSDPNTIEIKDRVILEESKCLKARDLYIDGNKRASVEQLKGGAIRFRFYPVGSFTVQEAQTWILGLSELSFHAVELVNAKK